MANSLAGILNLRAITLIALMGLTTFLRAADPPSVTPAHQKMIDRLDQVIEETAQNNSFLSPAKLEDFRDRHQKLTEGISQTERFFVTTTLAFEELRQGMERESIAHFEEAIQLTDRGKNLNGIQLEHYTSAVKMLTIACLRLAETENCCAQPSPESCIFPLRGAAIHTKDEGSRKAIFLLSQLLTNVSMNETSRGHSTWLLNLAYMTLGEHPDKVPEKWLIRLPEEAGPPSMKESGEPFPEFVNVAKSAGVNHFSLAGGASADDFDGDGDIDLFISSWDPAVSTRFLANDGTGTFTEKEAGLEGIRGGLNMKQADYDNDGDLDVLILRGAWLDKEGQHPNSLLRNDGKAHFTDVTYEIGLAEPQFPTQTGAWADYDLDGDLDLFIGNESSEEFRAPCQLFRNDDGRFTDVATEAGLRVEAFVKGTTWGDYDGDRYPDLFLSCLGEPNLLFRNRGDGTFENVTKILGASAGPLRSFPTWFFDYDNDGWIDLLVNSYRCSGLDYMNYFSGKALPNDRVPALFKNLSGLGFSNMTAEAWLARPTYPMGSNFGDLTNNGYPDIYLGSGDPGFESLVPNTLFINEAGQFYDLTMTSRMGHLQKGHAVSFADFDRDGDLDVFEQMGGALPGDGYFDALFQNPGFGRNWISIRLAGGRSNSFGVGSRVHVRIKDPEGTERSIYQWMSSGGSFGSNPLELHFGLGKAEAILKIEVFWPATGKTQTVVSPSMNQRIKIAEENSRN